MLESIDQKNKQGQRDYALLLMLFNTGARVQELLGICPGDLQLDRPCQVRLLGKGRKERICPLWSRTADSLRTLLGATSYPLDETAPIFRNRFGEPLTRFGVRYILHKYAERAQTTAPRLSSKRVHPHTFRHSTAVHLLRSGIDLVTIAHWLGHASVETTNRYTAVDLETKREALERAGPVPEISDSDLTSWKTDASVLKWLESL
jgi:site-specific recombinase XerD